MQEANFHNLNPIQNPRCTIHNSPALTCRKVVNGRPANRPNPNPGNPRLVEYHGFPDERDGEATDPV